MEPTTRPPRSVTTALAGLALGAAGAVLLVVGWWGVSGESLVALQLPYLASASIPGAALVVAGAVLVAGARRPTATDPRVDTLVALLTEAAADGPPADRADRAPAAPSEPESPGRA